MTDTRTPTAARTLRAPRPSRARVPELPPLERLDRTHQQMLDTGNSLLFEEAQAPYYPSAPPLYGAGGGGQFGAVAPYSQHVYYPGQGGGRDQPNYY